LLRDYPIQFFEKHGLGWGRGFRYDLIEPNESLLNLLRGKIVRVYRSLVGYGDFIVASPSLSYSLAPSYVDLDPVHLDAHELENLEEGRWEVV
jgi:hypothetical protein